MKKKHVYIALIFLWIGFLGAISFMEAWLKFRAEGVSLPLGLSIGRLVFRALNSVEIVIVLSIIITSFFYGKEINKLLYKLIIPILFVFFQTIYLLPKLDERAQQIIKGLTVADDYSHISYVILEVIKMIILLLTGIQLIRSKNESI